MERATVRTVTVAAIGIAGALGLGSAAHAHATYNLSGYGAGIPGSTNGADGSPTAEPPATWTNGGVAEYVGALPVNWYAGMHSATQVRTLQTGVAPNPPSGSLLAQVIAFNAAGDPDLETDRVLAVGGKSWSDPENSNQGWGHGLDYGLIHFSPVEDLLADGPVKFTVTLADDPTDGVAVRLAFAIYAGWDTSATSVRHQTFDTAPSPVDNPLGATFLTLLDFAVATAPGQTLSRTLTLDAERAGAYTVLVAALGGESGQYQISVAAAPDETLGACEDELADVTADADGDGAPDAIDVCPDTLSASEVDLAGCSLAEFCGAIDATTKAGAKACGKADWQNDEAVMGKKDKDCSVEKPAKLCVPAL